MSVGGAIISAIGGLLGGNKAAKEARRSALNRLPYLRTSAEAAGFNPLTALLATGGAGFDSDGGASLASSQAVFGSLADLFDAAGDARRERAEAKAAKLEQETRELGGELRGSARSVAIQDSLRTRSSAATTYSQDVAEAVSVPLASTDIGLEGSQWNTDNADPRDTAEHAGSLVRTWTLPNNRVMSIPEGPDLDSVASGLGALAWDRWSQVGEQLVEDWERQGVPSTPDVDGNVPFLSWEWANPDPVRPTPRPYRRSPFRLTLPPSFN